MKGLMGERKKSKKRESPERKAAREAQAAHVGRVLTVAATTAVFGAIGAGLLIGVPRLQAGLAAKSAAAPVRIVFDWPGTGGNTWLPPEVRDELLAAAYAEVERSPDPFSAAGLKLIGETAAASGWFERVRAVRREADGSIRVDGLWRTPVGVVRRDGTDYVVARGGELLPLRFTQGGSKFKAIVGAQLNPPVQAGAAWPGADVKAGLELLTLISTKPWFHQVEAVDVSEYMTGRQLSLVTTRRGRVVWGGGPSDSIPGQVSTQAKLLRLDGLYHQTQMIDAGHRAVWVSGPVTTVDNSATADAS